MCEGRLGERLDVVRQRQRRLNRFAIKVANVDRSFGPDGHIDRTAPVIGGSEELAILVGALGGLFELEADLAEPRRAERRGMRLQRVRDPPGGLRLGVRDGFPEQLQLGRRLFQQGVDQLADERPTLRAASARLGKPLQRLHVDGASLGQSTLPRRLACQPTGWPSFG